MKTPDNTWDEPVLLAKAKLYMEIALERETGIPGSFPLGKPCHWKLLGLGPPLPESSPRPVGEAHAQTNRTAGTSFMH